jgi:type VI secretion system protein ImpH
VIRRALSWSTDWLAEHAPLREVLCREGYRFQFFQAVRLLQLLWPERRPVGRFAAPAEEVVRFRAHLSLSFPASDIQPAAHDPDAGPWVIVPPGRDEDEGRSEPGQLTAAFGTLTGIAGALPGHYTTHLLERAYGRGGKRPDSAMRDFLDLFNHGMLSLLYRAWEKTRPVVQIEQRLLGTGQADRTARLPGEEDAPDDFTRYLFSLIGMGTRRLRGRQEFSDDFLLSYAGPLSGRTRAAGTLREVVADWLHLSPEQVAVEQFCGGYYPLPEEARSFVGVQCCVSGEDAIVGDAAWVQDARFRLRLGPLSLRRFASLMPSGGDEDGRTFRALVQLVRFFVGPELDFDIQLLLAPEDLSRCVLGAEGDFSLRVGLTAWLLHDEHAPGLSDTVFAGTMTGLAPQPRSGAHERNA